MHDKFETFDLIAHRMHIASCACGHACEVTIFNKQGDSRASVFVYLL